MYFWLEIPQERSSQANTGLSIQAENNEYSKEANDDQTGFFMKHLDHQASGGN